MFGSIILYFLYGLNSYELFIFLKKCYNFPLKNSKLENNSIFSS